MRPPPLPPTARRAAAPAAAALVEADPRWARVLARDPAADGAFVYAVRTTGVCCRPSCPSRRPRPEHVEFHADVAAARAAGFRACRRCAPEGPAPADVRAARVAALCRRLERDGPTPTLADLGRLVGLSPFHVARVFRAATGVTVRAYAAAHRARRARATLRTRPTVAAAHAAAGYGSASRFYATAAARLGMTPRAYRAGGAGLELRYATAPCDLGTVLVAATPRGIAAILLGDADGPLVRDLARRFPRATRVRDAAGLASRVRDVVRAVAEPRLAARLPLDVRGTAFQQRVWAALAAVPAGATTTYAAVARARRAARGARRGRRVRGQSRRRRDPVPSRAALGRRARGLSLGRRAQTRPARARGRRDDRGPPSRAPRWVNPGPRAAIHATMRRVERVHGPVRRSSCSPFADPGASAPTTTIARPIRCGPSSEFGSRLAPPAHAVSRVLTVVSALARPDPRAVRAADGPWAPAAARARASRRAPPTAPRLRAPSLRAPFLRASSGASRAAPRPRGPLWVRVLCDGCSVKHRPSCSDGRPAASTRPESFRTAALSSTKAIMGKRIYCGNLSFQSSQDDVRALFSAHGEVTDVHMVMDRETGRPRGFAFVEMATDEQAKAAIQALDGHSAGGRNLKVNEAQAREERGGGGGGYGGGGGGGGYGGGSRGGRY